MPRAKKDGQHINCYIDRTLCERLKAYADEKGQTMTMALERILKQYFESENKEAIDKDDMEALCSDEFEKRKGLKSLCKRKSLFSLSLLG